jgi:hypothetical protein
MVPNDRLSERECEELYAKAEKATTLAKSSADASCTKDHDCTQSQAGPSCFAGCGGSAVSVKGAASLNAGLTRIDDEVCRRWVSGGCRETTPKPVPSCAPYKAKCIKGRCDNVLGTGRD